MVGKGIGEQLSALRDKLREPVAATRTQHAARTNQPALDYSSPFAASDLDKKALASGLLDNSRSTSSQPRHEHHPADPRWSARVKHRQHLTRRGLPYGGSFSSASTARRTNHCYNCKARVDSQIHDLCSICSQLNIICPNCGSCGCGYGSMSQVADEIEIGDDVASWLVSEGGIIVFPEAVAGVPESAIMSSRRDAYERYLQSATRREKRAGALKNAWHRCEECGNPRAGLHVHHKTYKRFGGGELPEDLQVLCADCHYRHHEFAAAHVGYIRGDPA